MPNVNTTEKNAPTAFERPPDDQVPGALSAVALGSVGKSAANFYGGTHSIERTPEGQYHSVIGGEMVVGAGDSSEAALVDTQRNMEARETLAPTIDGFKTTTVWMADGSKVLFTPTEEYNPKIAPSDTPYEPSSPAAKEIIEMPCDNLTYKNTIEAEGWQDAVFGVLKEYLVVDPDGNKLIESLNIGSIRHLTPRQAMQLSLSFVQNVSKYEADGQGRPTGDRADAMTTLQLLQEGMERRNDPTWRGNGVCRNIAANVKVVFEAIKHNQSKLSMLNNTYCLYDSGGQESYALTRQERRSNTGHAWNLFVTFDVNGSRTETMADATWALGEEFDPTLEHFDRTRERAASRIFRTIRMSGKPRPDIAFYLTDFTNDQLRYRLFKSRSHKEYMQNRPRRQAEGEIEIYDPSVWMLPARQSIVTKYLDEIKGYLDCVEGVSTDEIISTALTMKDRLRQQELETILILSADQEEAKRKFVEGYANQESDDNIYGESLVKRGNGIGYDFSVNRYVFRDDVLQKAIFDSMNKDLLDRRSKTSEHFRARLREVMPDKLPPFDPRIREEDLREAKSLVSGRDFKWDADMSFDDVIRVNRDRLLLELGADTYARHVKGVSDYEFIKNYGSLVYHARNN